MSDALMEISERAKRVRRNICASFDLCLSQGRAFLARQAGGPERAALRLRQPRAPSPEPRVASPDVIPSIRRFDSQHHAVREVAANGAFSRDVDITVRALLDVTNSDVERHEQWLAPLGLRWL